jgi:hypothetical protein
MITSKRILRDVQTMVSDELTSLGIYYTYQDTTIQKGHCLLIGPPDTPYAGCPLLFSITLPAQYPFVSPTVVFETSDAHTRFHPNLYVGGKVCLSILGTFAGPSWATAMNIGTVFKSIFSLLNENPIQNEPGWESYTLEHAKAKSYADWVQYRLLRLTIRTWAVARGDISKSQWAPFKDVFESDVWETAWKSIRGILEARVAQGDVEYTDIPYGMAGKTNWEGLLEEYIRASPAE